LGTRWFGYELVVGTSWLGYELARYDLVRVRVDRHPHDLLRKSKFAAFTALKPSFLSMFNPGFGADRCPGYPDF